MRPPSSMNRSLIARRALLGAATVLLAVMAVTVTLGMALATGHFRGSVTRFIAARAARPVEIDGPLEVHILSRHPQVIASNVTVGNPPWVPAGSAAQFGKITLVFALPWFGRSWGIEKLEIEAATLHLARDAAGRANWQWSAPGTPGGPLMPIIRQLSMPDARVELDDARRHLQFRGNVSATEVDGPKNSRPLRIDGAGQLNGSSATFRIDGDPLAAASHAVPYHFTFAEHSSGSHLTGSGSLTRPFDFSVLEAQFEATGPDLKDLYLLTGVTLIHTGAYRISGKLARHGHHLLFSDLLGETGQSDVRGSVTIDTSDARPHSEADLTSKFLHVADLGARAAGRDPGTGPPLLLSNTSFKPEAARHGDGTFNFHGRRVQIGRLMLQNVAAKLTIDHGILVVAPLAGDVLQGKFTARARIDATTDDPSTDLEMTIKDLQLGQLLGKGAAPPPMEGALQIRVRAQGRGTSLHQIAASGDGTLTAVLPTGTLRASLAELTGFDLRGVGLTLARSTRETAVHCAVASFRLHAGGMTAQSLVVDTDPVLITGDGAIHLDTEALDLTLRGQPKGVRILRLRSPLLVRGTLSHPSFGLQARGSELKFVDPGLAKGADCAGLLAAANAAEADKSAGPLTPPAR
jgi:uncharacterized protein involved in outer membrane biogenesis